MLSSSISDAKAAVEAEMQVPVTQKRVRELAIRAGFVEAGIVGVPHAQMERDAERFARFVEAGHAGTMHYLERRNEQGELVRSQVHVPFPWAQSVVVCLASYHADAPLSTQPADEGAGWIARYSWSSKKNEKGETRPSDYHKVLLKRLKALDVEMRGVFGEFESRAYVDTGPVMERAIARAAGVGWTGKNTCLIHPKLGSWNFLAVLVTSLPVAQEIAPMIVADRCGSCTRCLDACPTGALTEPYRMDATRCISYLTIEHKGAISEELMQGMGRQVFGCDICQDVCPWNRKAPIGRDEEMAPRRELVNPGLEWLAELQEADFERLFNGSPIRRTGFAGLRRNIVIAMGNSGLSRFLPWLNRLAETGDGDQPDTVSGAARWALNRIESNQGR